MDSHGVRGDGYLSPAETPVSFEPTEELLRSAEGAFPDGNEHDQRGAAATLLSKAFSPVRGLYRIIKADFGKDGHPVGDAAVTAASAGVIAIGLTRLPTVMVPKVTAEILQHTHSAVEVAAATGAMVAAWCFTSGQTLNEGISRYPTGVATVEAKLPAVTGLFSDSLPGLEAAADGDKARRRSLAARIGNTLLTHGRRGVTTVGIGVAPYVGAAHVKGVPKPTIRRLVAKSAVDGGAITGLVTGSVAEAVILVGHSNPGLARGILNGLGDTKLWWMAAGGLMVAEGAAKIRGRRKASRGNAVTNQIPAPELSPQPGIPGSDIGEAAGVDSGFGGPELRLRAKLEQELNS